MDFFFVGDEDQNEKLAVLAARERTTRMTMSEQGRATVLGKEGAGIPEGDRGRTSR